VSTVVSALNLVSLLLESPGRTLTADDLRELPDETRGQLLQLGILKAAPPARSVACDACEAGHVEEITRTRQRNGGTLYHIRCPDAGWVEVPKMRLEQWALDTAKLAGLLAGGVQNGALASVLVEDWAWHLSEQEIGGVVYNIVLARNGNLDGIANKARRDRTILVLPSPRDIEDSEYAAYVSLSDAFECKERFVLRLNRVRAALGIELSAINAFRKNGKVWNLSFESEAISIKHSVGLDYLATLLANPDRGVPAVELKAAHVGINGVALRGSAGEFLDDEALKAYRSRYHELEGEIQLAELNNDPAKAEQLKLERQQLAKEVSRATGFAGRVRESSEVEKARKAVSQAVGRAIRDITELHKSLGDHLLKYVHTGGECRYSPPTQTDWLI
jgi:hypothetical protein